MYDYGRYIQRLLDSALDVDESSASHAYTVLFNDQAGYFDIVFNLPLTFPVDVNLHRKIQSILAGGLYPDLMLYIDQAPRFVSTESTAIETRRALRYYFKHGQYKRLRVKNLDQARMEGSVIPLMSGGYGFDLYGASGMAGFSGASGNGKTILMEYCLACVANSMPESTIVIVDPKLDFSLANFAYKKGLRYLTPSGNNNDFFLSVKDELSKAIDEIHRRQSAIMETGKVDFPPYILAIDEGMAIMASITDSKRVKEYQALLTQITLMGRSARVFLFISAQTFDATSVMNSSSRDQLAFSVVLSAHPSANDCRFLFKDFDPSNSVINFDDFKKGVGLASTQPDNRVVPFLAPYIEEV